MPRFFFDIFNGHGEVRDEEGSDLANQAAAKIVALDSIRSMVSEDVGEGVIDLSGRIEVRDADRAMLLLINYAEAFELRLPKPDQADE